MPKSTGRGKYIGDELVTSPSDLNDQPERKDQFLKRIKAEKAANKKYSKKVDGWIEVRGKKVLALVRNASGSVYRQYLFNKDKLKDQYNELKTTGHMNVQLSESTTLDLPLKFINGKPV